MRCLSIVHTVDAESVKTKGVLLSLLDDFGTNEIAESVTKITGSGWHSQVIIIFRYFVINIMTVGECAARGQRFKLSKLTGKVNFTDDFFTRSIYYTDFKSSDPSF